MIELESKICVTHKALIDIFIEACELEDLYAVTGKLMLNGKSHDVLTFVCNNADTEARMSFMSLRHSGFLNMLDDYLLTCGVPVDALQPKTYHRQLQDEREAAENKKFMELFEAKRQKYEHTNK